MDEQPVQGLLKTELCQLNISWHKTEKVSSLRNTKYYVIQYYVILLDVTLEMSTWELGFESPEEMYPDSPVEFQPDLWLVRRIEPETNAALKNINGWFERYIYSQPKKHRIYQTSNRMPNGPRLILNKMGLFRLNDWSIQYNTKGQDTRLLRNGTIT